MTKLDTKRVRITNDGYGAGRIMVTISEQQARTIAYKLLNKLAPGFTYENSDWSNGGPGHLADWFWVTADHQTTGMSSAFVELGEICVIGVSTDFTNQDDPKGLDGTRKAAVPSDHDLLNAAAVLRELLKLAEP
jgi:hypothetical protein